MVNKVVLRAKNRKNLEMTEITEKRSSKVSLGQRAMKRTKTRDADHATRASR